MKAAVICTRIEKGLFPVNERTPDSMLRFAGRTAAELAVKSAADASNEIYALSDFLAEREKAYFESADLGGEKPEFVNLVGGLCRQLYELSEGEDILAIEAASAAELPLGGFVKFYNAMKEDRAVTSAICAVKPSDSTTGCKIRCDDAIAEAFIGDEFDADEDYEGVFAGAMILSHEMLERIKDRDHKTLSEIITSELSEDGSMAVYFSPGSFYSLYTPSDYRNAALGMLSEGRVSESAAQPTEGIYSCEDVSVSGITLIPPVYIGRGAKLEKGCVIENCVIEDNAVIGSRAELRGCVIGESAVVGAGVRAAAAVICAGAEIRPAAQLCENCVIGEKATVGSGSQISAGVSVAAERRTAAGEIVSENVVSCDGGSPASLDDDCACGFSSGVSSPAECTSFAMAVGSALSEGTIAVCGASGGRGASALLSAFESGLSSAGITVISVGESSGQEVMFLVNRLGAEIGCYISADFSERIQLMSRGGLPLSGRLQSAIERSCALKRRRSVPLSGYGERYDMSEAKALYKIFLSQLLPTVLKGVNADIRCSVGSLCSLAENVVRPRNDLEGERIIFHISNDGKTCTAYTDATGYVVGERLALLAVKAAFEKDIPVALPFTFPMAADKIAESMGGKLYRYFHSPLGGSDDAARAVACRPDNFFVRDGIVLMCMISSYLSEHSLTLSQALEDVPEFYSTQRFAVTRSSPTEIYSALGCRREGTGEGIVVQHGSTRAMVRPLRHRQGIMIFTESVKAEIASELCDEIIKKLKNS